MAVIAQAENIKLYLISGETWTLQQTIPIAGVRAMDVSADGTVLLAALEDSLQVYQLEGSSFAKVKGVLYGDVKAISTFQLGNKQWSILQSSSGSSIVELTGLEMVWQTNVTDFIVPLMAPQETSESVLLATAGRMSSVSSIALLKEQPDYIPR